MASTQEQIKSAIEGFLAQVPALAKLLEAREQFHVHLMHKPNVVGTAVGRYLIRKTDPQPPGPKAPGARRDGGQNKIGFEEW